MYPGARVAQRHFEGTTYYIGKNYKTIAAEPYSLAVSWLVADGPTGTGIMRLFRKALPARGWACTFIARMQGELRRFTCARGHERLRASISDSGGYVIEVVASIVRPPIKQVPQVE